MNLTLTEGDLIRFQPDGSWAFEGFDGKVRLKPSVRSLGIDEGMVVVADDLMAMALQLIGVSYKAKGFDKVAGKLLSANVSIYEDTLSSVLMCEGIRVARAATCGTFKVKCMPSLSGGTPPIPDPQAASRGGTWSVENVRQSILQTE